MLELIFQSGYNHLGCDIWSFTLVFGFFNRVKSENANLSYDVTVIQFRTSCHKNHITTRYRTLGYWHVTSHKLTTLCFQLK